MNRYLPLAAIIIATSLTLPSCSSDNNDDEQGNQPSSSSGTDPSSNSTETEVVVHKCGGSVIYNPAIETCCGSNKLTIANEICDTRDNQIYGFVTIGTGENAQTWLAKNLNYDVPDNDTDVCFDDEPDNCKIYGRLYDWETAMDNAESSNEIPSGVQGICPEGWHLPSNAEWDKLFRYVDGTSGESSPYDSPTAGRDLKSKTGWYNCGPSGSGSSYSCEDAHGFSALPGGLGGSDGNFYDVGNLGRWWSSDENVYGSDYAYYRYMYYSNEDAIWDNGYRTFLFSVRCLQD